MLELYHHGSSVCAAKVSMYMLEKDLDWKDLKHDIISEINHYYSAGNDVVVKKNIAQSISDSKPTDIDQIENTTHYSHEDQPKAEIE